jgi:hypothetical protein
VSEETYTAGEDLRNGLVTTHEDLSIVLIKSSLVITNSWHVLDDNGVIWMLAWTVKDSVGFDHVIDNVGLGNLLGAELLVRAQVLSIIVTKMVVAGDRGELDTSVDQEIDKSRLHLGLTRLEVVTANECTMLLSKLNGTWDEGVLWRTVDEWYAFKDGSNGEDGGWCNLLVTLLNCLQQVLGSIVDTIDEIGETLGVGSPLNNDLIKVVVGLELTGA